MVDWWCVDEFEVVTIVAAVVCGDEQTSLLQSCDRTGKRFVYQGQLPEAVGHVALIDVVIATHEPILVVKPGDATRVIQIPPRRKSRLAQVRELCSSMGAFSSLWHRADFQARLGVDQNSAWEDLFYATHKASSGNFLRADAGSSTVVKQIYDQGLCHGIILAGISCQPFSRLGDQAGMSDCRASSLGAVLNTAWASQASMVILECVPPVLHNKEFREELRNFCRLTGYQLSQQGLDLKMTWCTRRERWIGVLSAPGFGVCQVPPLPVHPARQKIGDVMVYLKQWSDEVLNQLQLSNHELTQFTMYAVGGIESLYLDLQGVLPTSLHSFGNQLARCACGCRGP